MPLSQQLKSEMTGIPADASTEKQSDEPVAEPADMPDTSGSKDTEAPAPETSASPQAPPPSEVPDPITLLLSIEGRLKGLSDTVRSLAQAVSQSKEPAFDAVFAKIDEARLGIEKLLPTGNEQPAPEAETGNSQLLTLIQTIFEKQDRNDRKLAQMLRENANFQIQVRQGMQQDLDKLKKQANGEQFNPILKEIAAVYVEYQPLLKDETLSDHTRKNIEALFEQLEEIMGDYGAEVRRSEIGSVRQTKTCKITAKTPTGQQEKHNTIAESKQPGVVRDNLVLYPEFVNVFVYDPTLEENAATANEAEKETDEAAACEADSKEIADTEIDSPNDNNLGGNE